MLCGGSSRFCFLSSIPIVSGFGRYNLMFNPAMAYYEMKHATW
jgi:hypothetical protein